MVNLVIVIIQVAYTSYTEIIFQLGVLSEYFLILEWIYFQSISVTVSTDLTPNLGGPISVVAAAAPDGFESWGTSYYPFTRERLRLRLDQR